MRVSGPWDLSRAEAFLTDALIPLRLAVLDGGGTPILVSLWFLYEDGTLWCATQRNARTARQLEADPRCAFEIAPDEPPYCGIRGQAVAVVRADAGERILARLLDRYGQRDTDLERWLLSRAADEVALQLKPKALHTWDFSNRMR